VICFVLKCAFSKMQVIGQHLSCFICASMMKIFFIKYVLHLYRNLDPLTETVSFCCFYTSSDYPIP